MEFIFTCPASSQSTKAAMACPNTAGIVPSACMQQGID